MGPSGFSQANPGKISSDLIFQNKNNDSSIPITKDKLRRFNRPRVGISQDALRGEYNETIGSSIESVEDIQINGSPIKKPMPKKPIEENQA